MLENTLADERFHLIPPHKERCVPVQVHHPGVRHELTCAPPLVNEYAQDHDDTKEERRSKVENGGAGKGSPSRKKGEGRYGISHSTDRSPPSL